jgi:hypothetical protein
MWFIIDSSERTNLNWRIEMNVTVHNFTKTQKSVSVNGSSFAKAYKENGVWAIFRNDKKIGSADSVRGIEMAVASFIKAN